jgi:hypothetical protein
MPRSWTRCLTLLAIVASTRAAHADSDRAQQLFDEGIAALSRADYMTACSRLTESLQEESSVGTLVKLAECEEKRLLLTDARSHLAQALDLAEKTGDLRIDAIRLRVARIEQIAPKLRIVRPLPGVAVTVDGAPLAEDHFDLPYAIDPGHHVISASAAGHAEWRFDAETRLDHTTVVVIPPLLELPLLSPPQVTPRAVMDSSRTTTDVQRLAGYALVGAGGVALAVGAVAGLMALHAKSTHCDAAGICDPGSTDGIKTAAAVSNVGWISGGVLLGTGTVLMILAPKSSTSAASGVVPRTPVTGGDVAAESQ